MLSNLRKLKQILTRREQLLFLFLLCAITAMAFTQALGVASVMPFLGLILDSSIIYDNKWLIFIYDALNFKSSKSFIYFTGIMIFGIIVLANAISAFTTWMKIRISLMNHHRLSRSLLEKYLAMPYTFFLNQNSSELSKNILSDVNFFTDSYLMPLLGLVSKAFLTLFILLALFWVDALVSLFALFFIGGSYALIYWVVNKKLIYLGSERMKANNMRYRLVYEALGGIKEIKVLNRDKYFLDQYSSASFLHSRYNSWSSVVSQLPRFALEAIAFGGIIIYSLFLLFVYEDARQMIPLAGLFALSGYRLLPALQEIFTSLASMRYSQAVLDSIHNDMLPVIKNNKPAKIFNGSIPEPLIFMKEIKLDRISYNYPNTSHPVINEINLTIKCNTMVAFVGPTGSGKTTLVDIILGLLIPQNGALYVDDQQINNINLKSWQANLGYVPQHIYLSDDSVARNIAFGIPDEDIDSAALKRASRLANIEGFIVNEMPEGFNTLVGERGVRLSGGQRQRIGIARALYHDPRVLIFDEATSSLDGITEEAILKAMDNIAELKTLIIIAHRLTTIKNCDIVYMLNKGRIVASGTYKELIAYNKQFKAMAK
jgi:ATP-binding cassette, subfamily B, bacterial PglK